MGTNRLRLPRAGLGALTPLTLSETGAVKPVTYTHTHAHLHTHTHTMSIHGPDRGHWGPYAKQSVEDLRLLPSSCTAVAALRPQQLRLRCQSHMDNIAQSEI